MMALVTMRMKAICIQRCREPQIRQVAALKRRCDTGVLVDK